MLKILKIIYKDLKDFFLDLENLDERRKKIWFFVGVSLSMILILIIWFIQFNDLVKVKVISENQKENQATQTINSSSPSFFSTFSRGLKISFSKIKNFFDDLKEKWKKGKENLYNIFRKTNNFSIEGNRLNFSRFEANPVTPLP